MKITKVEVQNYRLLKDFSIDFEDYLSLVVGKNNTGKTSFLQILQKFLCTSSNNFSFEDFHVELQKNISDTKEIDPQIFKEAFKKIFEDSEYEAHYNRMMK